MTNKYMIPQKQTRELAVKASARIGERTLPNVETLIDSGCTHTCISKKIVEQENLPTTKMERPMDALNADGTQNKQGRITDYVQMEIEIEGHKEQIQAPVVQLEDRADMFMGHDWLIKHNPEVDWHKGTIKFTRCPSDCTIQHREIELPPKFRRLMTDDIAWEEEEEEPDPTNPEDLPDYIRPFTHLFNKKTFEKLPERTEWDHEIQLMQEAPKDLGGKTYDMTIKEQGELREFLKENLESGRIRPSKSPYAAPFLLPFGPLLGLLVLPAMVFPGR